MSGIKSWLSALLDKADDALDSAKTTLKTKLNLFKPLEVVVYNGIISQRLRFSGRVLENRNIKAASAEDSTWDNLVASYKRINSDEIAGAKLACTFQGQDYEATSDKEGYFYFDIPVQPNAELPVQFPFEVEVRLLDAPVPHDKATIGKGKIFGASADAKIAVVSDIDDTILHTSAINILEMAKNTFFSNAQKRKSFEGVAEFYKALQVGQTKKAYQPVFYVSSSPWNLFDMLTDFLELQQIPEGPLFLRDFGVDEGKLGTGTHGDHKYLTIKKLLEDYPQLSFVLIGDSGQQDMEIYRRLGEDFKDRIAAIYIRDVNQESREGWEKEQLDKAKASSVDMQLSADTVDFLRDAKAKGLISE